MDRAVGPCMWWGDGILGAMPQAGMGCVVGAEGAGELGGVATDDQDSTPGP